MKNDIIIKKMLGYTCKILEYCKDMTYEEFIKNDMLVEACVFNLSQMGELANKIDASYRAENKQIAWNQM